MGFNYFPFLQMEKSKHLAVKQLSKGHLAARMSDSVAPAVTSVLCCTQSLSLVGL